MSQDSQRHTPEYQAMNNIGSMIGSVCCNDYQYGQSFRRGPIDRKFTKISLHQIYDTCRKCLVSEKIHLNYPPKDSSFGALEPKQDKKTITSAKILLQNEQEYKNTQKPARNTRHIYNSNPQINLGFYSHCILKRMNAICYDAL